MRKIFFVFIVLFHHCIFNSNAQTAMPLSGPDCNGINHDLFADLDAGKAVLLHFFMDNCGSCPPPAQNIQAMANKIMSFHPGMIKGYALPYNNSTNCAAVANWVSSNGLNLYMPYDSGATQVAHYGGFGMPTVVLLGGSNHRIMFSTQSFVASDTTIMRDSILALLQDANSLMKVADEINNFQVFPNPANEFVQINLDLKSNSEVNIEMNDMNGKRVVFLREVNQVGLINKQINISALANGNYLIKVWINGLSISKPITVKH